MSRGAPRPPASHHRCSLQLVKNLRGFLFSMHARLVACVSRLFGLGPRRRRVVHLRLCVECLKLPRRLERTRERESLSRGSAERLLRRGAGRVAEELVRAEEDLRRRGVSRSGPTERMAQEGRTSRLGSTSSLCTTCSKSASAPSRSPSARLASAAATSHSALPCPCVCSCASTNAEGCASAPPRRDATPDERTDETDGFGEVACERRTTRGRKAGDEG